CTSCHDPHDNRYGKFLVKPNANAALCTTCHQKTNYTSSAHAVSHLAYTPPGGSATTVREYSCRSCHQTHGASTAQAYLLRGAEENTCYLCHGSPALSGAKNIKNLFAKAYKHPTETSAGLHKNPELDASNLGPGRRHAECWDCHNPHQAQTGTHTVGTASGNLIGKALLGQWGVEPSWGSTAWVTAASYVRQVFTGTTGFKEYQLCLKCHSSYAFASSPPAGITDQAIELNPYNRGAHPLRAGLSSQAGATSPKALAASQMSAPWTAMGSQTMSCSDCHDSDAASDPKGPHGSAASRILKGPRKYWPKNAANALWTLQDVRNNQNSWSTDLFCVNCHPLRSGSNWLSEPHDAHDSRTFDGQGMKCVMCHSVNPHGSKRSRLIVYDTEPAPYNYSGTGTFDKALIKGFKKASSPTNYAKGNCYTISGCHGNTNTGGYDP
ncbi:MAG: hypothetical protein HY926_01690, partial [Elusimicrobia bacterium]|nr:hypothetical protein [Elusimicrobiota bacterium]